MTKRICVPFHRVAGVLILLAVLCLCGSVSAQQLPIMLESQQLKKFGVFGFPMEKAQAIVDDEQLRLMCVSDNQNLWVQGVVWRDETSELGETTDGRAIGDHASLVIDTDANQQVTAGRDRTYSLNPWPVRPGLHYSIRFRGGASSKLMDDSAGVGAIRYFRTADDRTVRVDNFVIPLKELQVQTGGSIALGYLCQDVSTKSVYHSADGNGKRKVRYGRDMLMANFFTHQLVPTDAALDFSQVPRGRDDKPAHERPTKAPLLVQGKTPPPIDVADWINSETWVNADEGLSWKELRGKVVLVDFWATWCGPCVGGIPHLNDLQAKFGKDGFVVLGITDQSVSGIRPFTERVEMKYAVGCGSEMAFAFGAPAFPHAFLIGRDGKVFWQGNPGAEEFDDQVQAALHTTGARQENAAGPLALAEVPSAVIHKLAGRRNQELPRWQVELARELPAMGHRNWIVIADAAYPKQSAPGFKTVVTGANQLEVVEHVLKQIRSAAHVRPQVMVDSELEVVPEQDAVGVDAYRKQLKGKLAEFPTSQRPHEEILSELDESSKRFNVLILKTNMTIPYTSVFIRLECGYWNEAKEARLRERSR